MGEEVEGLGFDAEFVCVQCPPPCQGLLSRAIIIVDCLKIIVLQGITKC